MMEPEVSQGELYGEMMQMLTRMSEKLDTLAGNVATLRGDVATLRSDAALQHRHMMHRFDELKKRFLALETKVEEVCVFCGVSSQSHLSLPVVASQVALSLHAEPRRTGTIFPGCPLGT